jgi:2-polyprenyl-3-methyl-5-hydroxy-6-metoxy-1,4-benzoquinol methylase
MSIRHEIILAFVRQHQYGAESLGECAGFWYSQRDQFNSRSGDVLTLSPLTSSSNIQLIEEIATDALQCQWLNSFGINIATECSGVDTISLYECLDTHLRFFSPDTVVGSASFYAQLQVFDWYYMPHKWEHEVALQDIKPEARVLEVGCGFGDFVEQVHLQRDADVMGIELNAAAVDIAREKGRRVELASIEEIAVREPESYDVVCHFEVLEHVVNPLAFLQDCVRCLKAGGKLLIAVPNMDSFIRHAKGNLLNQPPHHMTQWRPRTFRSLPQYLPIRLQRIAFEPLALYHINWYIGVRIGQFPNIRYAKEIFRRVMKQLVKPTLKKGLRQTVRGHTQYVVFQKLI